MLRQELVMLTYSHRTLVIVCIFGMFCPYIIVVLHHEYYFIVFLEGALLENKFCCSMDGFTWPNAQDQEGCFALE
jgi:hypothetical protein